MNSFGERFKFTTYGESHGEAIGAVIDSIPAGIKIDEDFIQQELNLRKPGSNKFSTPRKEDDKVKILSGVFEGISTGTSLSLIIFNQNQKSRDYSNIKDIFRPSHADFTYFHKYGTRDYRGGGRSSARETAMRVAIGAIAQLILNEVGIDVQSGIYQIGDIKSKNLDFDYAKNSEIFSLDKDIEQKQKDLILKAKNSHDSIGASVKTKITNCPKGLGEPIYYKLDNILASAMMSINASKACEIGDGISSIEKFGSEFNDQIKSDGFCTNHSGGILGGISNGEDIDITTYFKPTPSIFIEQSTVDINNQNTMCKIKGRHDPCVGVRGSVVCNAMARIVIADMLLLNTTSKIENIKKIYN